MSPKEFASPLRYPGGKTAIFPFMSSLFYENSLIGYSYAEPYAGGCGLALQLLLNEFVDKIFNVIHRFKGQGFGNHIKKTILKIT